MNELAAGIVGALVGALAAYRLDIHRQEAQRNQRLADEAQRRRLQRQSIATALLADCRVLEQILRRLFRTKKAAMWRGQSPAQLYDVLRPELILFAPNTLSKVHGFFGLTRDVFVILSDLNGRTENTLTSYEHWVIRAKAGFALCALSDAVDALIDEGGSVPDEPAASMIYEPHLPDVPPPKLIAAAGSELEE